jgi:predicted NodU family carbamoyl transferase
MAEHGDPRKYRKEVESYFDGGTLCLNYNFHRGVLNWNPEPRNLQDQCDIAAAVQAKFASSVYSIMRYAKHLTDSNSLVYMGGCAMNSAANKEFNTMFKYQWSLPDPGDPSSAMGAVLYHSQHRTWRDWGDAKHIEIRV